ncbi:MAG: hypothetical protein GY898_33390 [Proteobacteria bacterium]|nr:hypothetical protein [Pseudomonadota bacterium]
MVGVSRAFQYPWRLVDPTALSRASAWIGYAVHNLAAFAVIAHARRQRMRFGDSFRGANWAMLAVHAGGIALHTAQTHWLYDGLAQDVPEISALGSVALLLMIVLILENRRRGFVLGKRAPFPERLQRVVREYHGYFFVWALVYTFWYHPTVATTGHLVGFFYLFLLLWQSVLMYHQAHRNKHWTLALELLVIPHGVLVALHQGNGLWPMFGFGFGAMFFLTQMYGLGWSTALRRAAWLVFAAAIVATYAAMGRLEQVHEITRIPVLDYGVVLLIWGGFAVADRGRRSPDL